MNCSIFALAALAALLATPLAAQPVSRSCDYKGEGKLGPLQVAFDEVSRSVTVKTHDGQVWRYQDGVTGRISPPSAKDDLGPVEQFVKLSPDRVEVGFRWPDDGSTGPSGLFRPRRRSRIRRSAASGVRCGTSRSADGAFGGMTSAMPPARFARSYSAATFGRCASEASSIASS